MCAKQVYQMKHFKNLVLRPKLAEICRRYGLRKIAEEPPAHGPTRSRLCQLPPELVLLIAKCLPPVAVLSLHATCRGLYTLLHSEDFSREDRSSFGLVLRIEKFRRLCKREDQAHKGLRRLLPPKSLLCAGCLEPHPRKYFPKAEIAKPSISRTCIGRQHAVRQCQHHSRTFESLHTITVDPGEMACHSYCKEFGCKLLWRLTPHGLLYNNGPRISRYYYSTEFEVSTHIPILRMCEPLRITRKEAAAAIRRMDNYLCPHVRVNDNLVLKCLSSTTSADFFDWDSRKDFVTTTGSGRCSVTPCDTTFRFDRRILRIGDHRTVCLDLWVVRNLGKLKSAMDPRWLAQIEPSEGACGHRKSRAQVLERRAVRLLGG